MLDYYAGNISSFLVALPLLSSWLFTTNYRYNMQVYNRK